MTRETIQAAITSYAAHGGQIQHLPDGPQPDRLDRPSCNPRAADNLRILAQSCASYMGAGHHG